MRADAKSMYHPRVPSPHDECYYAMQTWTKEKMTNLKRYMIPKIVRLKDRFEHIDDGAEAKSYGRRLNSLYNEPKFKK